jgi:hypothetical protein
MGEVISLPTEVPTDVERHIVALIEARSADSGNGIASAAPRGARSQASIRWRIPMIRG